MKSRAQPTLGKVIVTCDGTNSKMSNNDVWLIGNKINNLPTVNILSKKQVLQCLFGDLCGRTPRHINRSAKTIAKKMIAIAEKKKLTTIHAETCAIKIKKLYKLWYKFFKRKDRNSELEKANRKGFLKQLNEEFSVVKAKDFSIARKKKIKLSIRGSLKA